MLRILVPVDGSKTSLRAVERAIEDAKNSKSGAMLHLLNVQPPLSATGSSFLPRKTIAEYHKEEGLKALRGARRKLDATRINYEWHIAVGDPAAETCRYARGKKCDRLIVGTRGMGQVSNLVLGSVATKVIHLSPAPVTLVK